MSYIYWIIILSCYILLFGVSKQEIIYNPIISDKEYNQINYILIIQNNTVKTTSSQTLNIKKDFDKLFYNSYIFTHSLFLCKDESSNYILLVNNKYFRIKLSSEKEIEKVLSKKNLNSGNEYLGYITCSKSNKAPLSFGTNLCPTDLNEIIIYGKSGNKLVFYYVLEDKYFTTSIGNIDDSISCKLFKDSIYICIISSNDKIILTILAHICLLFSEEMQLIYSIEINDFKGYKNFILYDTSKSYYKILCAKSEDINNIECLAIYVEIKYSLFSLQPTINVKFYNLNNNYYLYFSYKEDNCNFTTYNSEYLICCGKKAIISCERRDINFNLINNFNINLPGINSNLTLENNDNNIKLIFSNQNDNENNIYEYFIYPPSCKNIQITIIPYQTVEIDLSDLFERKTNTNYYISFDNLPKNFSSLQINETIIDNDNKTLIEDKVNYLKIISKDNIEVKNYIINFKIYIEETYSNECQISLTIEPCFNSCKTCSESIYNSNTSEHNCIECKENYYPFENQKSNCFTKEDVEENHIDWYFEQNKSSYNLCHQNCKRCFGPSDNNCLECFSYNNTEYLFKGECLTQCPNKTFQSENYEGILICEDCYKNCETCSEKGNSSQMNCDSCSDDKINYNKGCFVIYNEMEKSFYNPENESEITSCHELFGNYIKENTSICIDEIEDGYFISNKKTGLLSVYDPNCESYSVDKTYCESCTNNYYLQEDICVSRCSLNYYLNNNVCFKCHDNCLNCSNGAIFDDDMKLRSMGCNKCKNNTMIQNDKNCFQIIIYEPNKIIFDISEIDSETENATCLNFNKSILYNTYECIPKPDNTFYVLTNEENTGVIKYCNEACDSCYGEGNSQDTNCIKCSEGYYKTEDSKTNCILESLIPPNYSKNKSDNIYYKNLVIPTTQIISETYKNINNSQLIFDFITSNITTSVINNSEVIQFISTSDKMSIEEQLKEGISPIDLGDCTDTIKEYYNISEEENLIILNQEKRYNNEKNKTSEINANSNNLEKYSQIEIYDLSGRKLDLSVCKNDIKILKYIGEDEKININSAKQYAGIGVDIFNASSGFFNDICFQYKTNDGKDIILNDRRTDIYQNISLCQNGCMYQGMNYDLMVANCICDSSSLQGEKNNSEYKYNNTEAIQFNSLVKSFLANSLLAFNIDVLYCYNLVFNSEILKSNIGFYIMLIMKAFQISCLIVFFIKRLKPIKNFLLNYMNSANPIKKQSINIQNRNTPKIIVNNSNGQYGRNNNIDSNNSIKKLVINQNKDNIISKNELFNKNKVVQKKLNLRNNYKNDIIINNLWPKKINKLDSNSPVLNGEEKSSIEKIEKDIINIENIDEHKETVISGGEKNQSQSDNNCIDKIKISQNDEELQDMEFNEALEQDKRGLIRIYWSYLVDSQIILGTFFTENYLDLLIIKLSFLMFTFQISFFLNALFYTDEYISNAYHNEGTLDFYSGLPKSFYSFIATSITTNLLKMLSNSKNELLKVIKNRKKEDNFINVVNNKIKKLSYKLIIYFISLFILGLFFFYYVSAFCAVYTHSQKYWFIGCLESFAIDTLFNFFLCIIIATLRYIAIQNEKKLLYSIANIIAIIL